VGLEGGTVARGSLHHYVLPFEFVFCVCVCVHARACMYSLLRFFCPPYIVCCRATGKLEFFVNRVSFL
jgi:hypothetical protein